MLTLLLHSLVQAPDGSAYPKIMPWSSICSHHEGDTLMKGRWTKETSDPRFDTGMTDKWG
jgi:hypothetical protein